MNLGIAPSRDRVQHGPLQRVLAAGHYDRSPSHRQPSPPALVAAAVVALGGSLLADWLIARLAVAVFPSTKGYQHFAFGDYSTLTILGVVVACLGWPLVTRFCSTPRWLFSRSAVVVTVVLLVPDLAIWLQGQPGRAVAFLALMHVAIAVVTYAALTGLAPERQRRPGAARTGAGRTTAP